MFSGLVEQTSLALELKSTKHLIRLVLKRPASFDSLKEGESICVDGLCLTLEKFNAEKMVFALGPETLKIINWTPEKLKDKIFNLERSITLQSTIGGHLLTGHVDGLALVKQIKKQGESLIVQIQVPSKFKNFFWEKGYIALNGVSLTVNKVKDRTLELCFIPKTLKMTNLSYIKKGDLLNFELDYMSRFFIHAFEAFCKKLS